MTHFLLDKHDSLSILVHKARPDWLAGKTAGLYKESAQNTNVGVRCQVSGVREKESRPLA